LQLKSIQLLKREIISNFSFAYLQVHTHQKLKIVVNMDGIVES